MQIDINYCPICGRKLGEEVICVNIAKMMDITIETKA